MIERLFKTQPALFALLWMIVSFLILLWLMAKFEFVLGIIACIINFLVMTQLRKWWDEAKSEETK